MFYHCVSMHEFRFMKRITLYACLFYAVCFCVMLWRTPSVQRMAEMKNLDVVQIQIELSETNARMSLLDGEVSGVEVYNAGVEVENSRRHSAAWWQKIKHPFGPSMDELQKKPEYCPLQKKDLAALTAQRDELKHRKQELEEQLGAAGLSFGDIAEAFLTEAPVIWLPALYYALGLILCAQMTKALLYFVIAPLVELLDPITFRRGGAIPQCALECKQVGQKSLDFELLPQESLIVRSEEYVRGYMADENLKRSTRWILSWRRLFMSMFSGLVMMVRYSNKSERPLNIHISSDEPSEYFARIDLDGSIPHFVTPSALIAVTGNIRFTACWRLWIPAWCIGQIHYYMLRGKGSIVVRSFGGVTSGGVSDKEKCTPVLKPHAVLTSGGAVRMHAKRTEVFWPYFFGRSSLYDLRLTGEGSYCSANAETPARTMVEGFVRILGSCIGRYLGF